MFYIFNNYIYYTLHVLDVIYRINIHTRVILFQCECNRPIDQKFCHTRFGDLFPPVDIPSLCYIIVLIQTNDFHFLMSYILVPCVSVASGLYRTSYMLSLSISFSIMLRLFHYRNLLVFFFFFTKTVMVFYSMSLLNSLSFHFFYHFVYFGWG